MSNEDFLTDDFFQELIRKSPLDSPSDDFVANVMEHIQPAPEIAPVTKPFFMLVKSSWPYILCAFALIIFLLTSDLPFTDYLPGKGFFLKTILPYFSNMFAGIKDMIAQSKYPTIGLMVVVAGGLLFLLDTLLNKKSRVQHHTMIL
ncbi:MAG: hypothetical protein NTX61_01085 [Bacteroidetes bacterium]|nr:hypothetical protein [Bacteroidota bacterium]